LIAVCCGAAIAACGSSAAPTSQSVDVGSEFTLAPSSKATVKGSGIEVLFVGISEDSRCPRDATCVWAGQVKARLDIAVSKRPATPHEVLEGEGTTVEGYQVKVLRVLPYPSTSTKIPPGGYRATLQVTRN